MSTNVHQQKRINSVATLLNSQAITTLPLAREQHWHVHHHCFLAGALMIDSGQDRDTDMQPLAV